jgi:hypothetical protein
LFKTSFSPGISGAALEKPPHRCLGSFGVPHMEVSHIEERRSASRPADPACPRCQYEWVSVTLRTSHVFYCRCEVCGEIWHVLKPDRQLQTPAHSTGLDASSHFQ